jgi:hypothetical protein
MSEYAKGVVIALGPEDGVAVAAVAVDRLCDQQNQSLQLAV